MNKRIWWLRWSTSWLRLFEGLVGILTLGIWNPDWATKRQELLAITLWLASELEMKKWENEPERYS